MDAGKLWILNDLIATKRVCFKIPVYQRNYDWSETNCNRLLDDIKTIIDTEDKHFLGTIVYMATKNTFSLKEYIVIDGQQRLTTMMILLKALYDVATEKGEDDCAEEINDDYLHNNHCAEEFKVKLKPVKTDNDQFLALLKNQFDVLDKDGHIYLNYEICKKRIEKWVSSGIETRQILNALEKLEIVEIVLTKGEDDPQIIFESINSTGLELSSADLIRNFLLMNAEDQEKLYEEYWLYIERALKKGKDYTNLNLFFMQYIVYKTNTPVNSDKLYERFVKFFKENQYTQESCLKELKYYADIFKSFVYDEGEYSEGTKKALKNIRLLKQTTCYPFLMHVFNDYKQGNIIDDNELEKITKMILNYLLRRMVCGIPSSSLRGFFIYLYNRVFKVTANKQKYYESINKFLCTVGSRDIMPTDTEFERALISANVYSNNTMCKFLLMDIENGDGKEVLSVDNLTIEHIMPQTLGVDWRYIQEKEHEEYLHVLGNLTVSGYNSELSNKSFTEKKKIIVENSKAVVLNKDVTDKNEWTTEHIKERSKRLAKILMDRYSIERIEDESIEFEYLTTVSVNQYNDVTGKKLVAFKFKGEVYRQNRYALMLQDVLRLLDEENSGLLERLANEDFSFSSFNPKHAHVSKSSDEMRWAWEIKDGIFIEANLSASSIMKFIDCVMDECGFDKTKFSVSIVSDEVMVEEDE